MKFLEAVEEMKAGKPVAREKWNELQTYCVIMLGSKTIWQIVINPQVNAGNWLPTVEDFDADDWKVLDAMPEVKPAEIAEVAEAA